MMFRHPMNVIAHCPFDGVQIHRANPRVTIVSTAANPRYIAARITEQCRAN
jgi:hypothetical protein